MSLILLLFVSAFSSTFALTTPIINPTTNDPYHALYAFIEGDTDYVETIKYLKGDITHKIIFLYLILI
jgi:hypothetical protein